MRIRRILLRRILLIVTVAAVLPAMACGARLSEEQLATARAGGGGGTATGGATTGGGTTGGATTGGETTGGGGTAGGGTTGGATTGGETTGGGGTTGGGEEGAAACTPAPGTTDPGITDTEIKFGNVSTITGPVPGFGESGRTGAKAYFEYINATQGGVCGRTLSLVPGDDGLDTARNRSETEKLKDQVFGFVGSTTVEDSGGASVIGGTNIPNCSLAIGDAAIQAPNYFSPNPIDPSGQTNATVPIWNWLRDNLGVTAVGIVYPDNPNAASRVTGYANDIGAAGLRVVGPIKVAVTETNYFGVATSMYEQGADSFITVLEINGISKLAQAVAQVSDQQGWVVKAPFYGAQVYGDQFVKLAGSAAEGAVIGLTHDIVENTANAQMQTLAEWYARVSGGKFPDFFAVMGWTAADLCVKGLQAAGPTPTRDAVTAALTALTDWDADGVLSPRSPGVKGGPQGFTIVKVEGGKFVRVYPDSGFAPA